MNKVETVHRTDDGLLNITKAVLLDQGFHVEVVRGDVDLILAENSYFIIGVCALNTIHELILAEPIALSTLALRAGSANLGPKKWDTYLVLLTQDKTGEDDAATRDLYAINYDTSRLRRIAHSGIDPTSAAVRHALAPFIEPASSTTDSTKSDALDSLLHALTSRGVSDELANRAISAFAQGAALDDVL